MTARHDSSSLAFSLKQQFGGLICSIFPYEPLSPAQLFLKDLFRPRSGLAGILYDLELHARCLERGGAVLSECFALVQSNPLTGESLHHAVLSHFKKEGYHVCGALPEGVVYGQGNARKVVGISTMQDMIVASVREISPQASEMYLQPLL